MYQVDVLVQGFPGRAVCHGGLGWSMRQDAAGRPECVGSRRAAIAARFAEDLELMTVIDLAGTS
jgi:hypothetical protein